MAYQVESRELTPELLASVIVECPMADLPRVMPESFGRVWEVITAQGVRPTGGAVALYHKYGEDSVRVEIGFTVATEIRADQGVSPSRLPGGLVLTTAHVGRYEEIGPAYQAIQVHAANSGLVLTESMWEVYLTDPVVEPDLSKHVTEIYWPVKVLRE